MLCLCSLRMRKFEEEKLFDVTCCHGDDDGDESKLSCVEFFWRKGFMLCVLEYEKRRVKSVYMLL